MSLHKYTQWHNHNCDTVHPCTIKELNESIKNELFQQVPSIFFSVRVNRFNVIHGDFLRNFRNVKWICFFFVHFFRLFFAYSYLLYGKHIKTLSVVWVEFAQWNIRLFARWIQVQSGWLSAHFLYFYLSITFLSWCVFFLLFSFFLFISFPLLLLFVSHSFRFFSLGYFFVRHRDLIIVIFENTSATKARNHSASNMERQHSGKACAINGRAVKSIFLSIHLR